MKGATEVPSTITVIIIQYTLIKRMKCELAFPISPTYCLNVKYSSHGLSPWKHTGAVGISHLATTLLPQEWRNGGIWEESWNQENTTGLSHKNLLRLSGEREFGAAFSFSLLPGTRTLSQSQGFSAVHLPRTLSPALSHGFHTTQRDRFSVLKGWESVNIWSSWTKSMKLCQFRPSAEPGNFLKHLFSPSHLRTTQYLTLSSPEAHASLFIHCPSFSQEATRWVPALI